MDKYGLLFDRRGFVSLARVYLVLKRISAAAMISTVRPPHSPWADLRRFLRKMSHSLISLPWTQEEYNETQREHDDYCYRILLAQCRPKWQIFQKLALLPFWMSFYNKSEIHQIGVGVQSLALLDLWGFWNCQSEANWWTWLVSPVV